MVDIFQNNIVSLAPRERVGVRGRVDSYYLQNSNYILYI